MKIREILREEFSDVIPRVVAFSGKKIFIELYKRPTTREIKDCSSYGSTRGMYVKSDNTLYIAKVIAKETNKQRTTLHNDIIYCLEKKNIIPSGLTNLYHKKENFDKVLAVETSEGSTTDWYLSESYNPEEIDLLKKHYERVPFDLHFELGPM